MNPKKIFDFIGEKNPRYELENILDTQPLLNHYNRHLIQFIDNPSEEFQLVVIERNPRSIEYIKNPSERAQLRAVEKDIYSIDYIKNPSEEIQLKLIDVDAVLIQYINNPSEEVQLNVLDINPHLFKLIKNPTDKVKNIYREILNDELELYKKQLTREPNRDYFKEKVGRIIEKLKKLDEN
jgi:hypothetical protein